MNIHRNSVGEYNFNTISEFKESMICGGEVVFTWKQEEYGIFRIKDNRGSYCVCESRSHITRWFSSLEDALEYRVGADRLRDVITQVTVTYRSL